jgi:hypothetical protein
MVASYFTPDGRAVIASYDTGRAYRWDIRPDTLKRHACAFAGRRLTRSEWEEILPDRDYRPACRNPAHKPGRLPLRDENECEADDRSGRSATARRTSGETPACVRGVRASIAGCAERAFLGRVGRLVSATHALATTRTRRRRTGAQREG